MVQGPKNVGPPVEFVRLCTKTTTLYTGLYVGFSKKHELTNFYELLN